MDAELESARRLFGEKVKELSLSMAKVDALTRQLEELQNGNTSNSYHVVSSAPNNSLKLKQECERLRSDLLNRRQMITVQTSELDFKKSLLNQKKSELHQLDQRIDELHDRLAKKKLLNQSQQQQNALVMQSRQQQLQMQQQQPFNHSNGVNGINIYSSLRSNHSGIIGHQIQSNKRPLLHPTPSSVPNFRSGVNVAAVEPMPRIVPVSVHSSPSSSTSFMTSPSITSSSTIIIRSSSSSKSLSNGSRESDSVDRVIYSKTEDLLTTSSTSCIDWQKVRRRPVIVDDDDMERALSSIPVPSSSSSPSSLTSPSSSSTSSSQESSPEQESSSKLLHKKTTSASTTNTSTFPSKGNIITREDGERISPADHRHQLLSSQANHPSHLLSQLHVPNAALSSPPSLDCMSDKKESTSGNKDSLLATTSSQTKDANSFHRQLNGDEKVISQDMMSVSQERHEEDSSPVSSMSCGSSASSSPPSSKILQSKPDSKEEEEKQHKITPIKTNNLTTTSLNHNNNHNDYREEESSPSLVKRMKGNLKHHSSSNNNSNLSTTSSSSINGSEVKQSDLDKHNNKSSQSHPPSSSSNLNNNHHPPSSGQQPHKPVTRRVSFDPLALLLDAALEGELDLVKKTALQVPDPSAAKDEGLTALHNAICAGHFPIVKFLVEFGCDVNAQDSDGWTPLHCAASCNNLKMVEFLVEHGACVFATTFSDHETAAEKCEEDEVGYDTCSQYLFSIQDKMGVVNGGLVYAVYDYEAQNSDELSFFDGDRISIIRKGDEQEVVWWWAKNDQSEGYVPRNLFGLFPRVRPLKSTVAVNGNGIEDHHDDNIHDSGNQK